MPTDRNFTVLAIDEAARLLDLPVSAVMELARHGYLAAATGASGELRFQLSDVKAFLARNADNGAGVGVLPQSFTSADLEPKELVELLDSRAEQMACRVFKIFSTVFPEAGRWPEPKQGEFVQRTKDRFEAILSVSDLGGDVDYELYRDLRAVGQSAARSGTPLPQLLIILRLSRDLVVQNAVELAEGGGRNGGYALAMLLTRILPTMDRLTDALAQGYWEATAS